METNIQMDLSENSINIDLTIPDQSNVFIIEHLRCLDLVTNQSSDAEIPAKFYFYWIFAHVIFIVTSRFLTTVAF